MCASQRIHLDPGQTRTVSFHLTSEDLAFFDQKGRWIVEPDRFEVMAGGYSDNIQSTTKFSVTRPVPIP
jgi:beta-glucosidase